MAIFAVLVATRHPLVNLDRLTLWRRCWEEASSPVLRDRIKLTEGEVEWEQLEKVAAYLRSLNLRDGELTCYNNTTHPLYLELDLEPSTRYLHFDTLLRFMPAHRETIRQALASSGQRYVVSDLRAAGLTPEQREEWYNSTDALPAGLPEGWVGRFPWSEPVVYKTTRYAVHKVTGPVKSLSFEQAILPDRVLHGK
jgi:hypothetical protein